MARFKNQREMLEALLAGKKLACGGWKPDHYFYMGNDGLLYYQNGSKIGSTTLGELWGAQLYESPKKKVKIAKYAYGSESLVINITLRKYENEKELKDDHLNSRFMTWAVRLLPTEETIEVEE